MPADDGGAVPGIGQIIEAVDAEDFAGIERIAALRPDLLKSQDENGMTPLRVAVVGASKEHAELVSLLLRLGADANQTDEMEYPILTDAKCPEIAEPLLKHGADPNRVAGSFSPMLKLASDGPVEVLKLLLDYGGDPNLKGEYGETPLMESIQGGNAECAELLLDRGASLPGERERERLFFGGIGPGREPVLDVLIAKGLSLSPSECITLKRPDFLRTAVAKEGDIDPDLMEKAAREGGKECVKVLIDLGYPKTLGAAVALDDRDAVRLMLSPGARRDTSTDVLEVAVTHASVEMVEMLTGAGLKYLVNPLVDAVHAGRLDMFEFLLSKGIGVEAWAPDELSPLEAAAGCGGEGFVRELLSRGADPNRMWELGKAPPLATAVRRGDLSICRLLLSYGANPAWEDDGGGSLLEKTSSEEIRALLKAHLEKESDA